MILNKSIFSKVLNAASKDVARWQWRHTITQHHPPPTDSPPAPEGIFDYSVGRLVDRTDDQRPATRDKYANQFASPLPLPLPHPSPPSHLHRSQVDMLLGNLLIKS